MVTRHLIVVRSGPGEPESASALLVAKAMLEQGHDVEIALLQDAVLCALASSRLESAKLLSRLLCSGANCCYLGPDLAMRGFGPCDVPAKCEPVDEGGLVDRLFDYGALVSGAF